MNPTTQSDIYALAMVIIEVTHQFRTPSVYDAHLLLQGVHRDHSVSKFHQRVRRGNGIKGGATDKTPWRRRHRAWTNSLEAH